MVDADPAIAGVQSSIFQPLGVPFHVRVNLTELTDGQDYVAYQVKLLYDDAPLDAIGFPSSFNTQPTASTGGNVLSFPSPDCAPNPAGDALMDDGVIGDTIENDQGINALLMVCADNGLIPITSTGDLVDFVFVCESSGTATLGIVSSPGDTHGGTQLLGPPPFNSIFMDSAVDATITCTADQDSDGIPDGEDNCPDVANVGQEDNDGDAVGDTCDADDDDDAIADELDTSHLVFSNTFTDVPLGGMTSGTIIDRAGLQLTITDLASPAGVSIEAEGSGGPAHISGCDSPPTDLFVNDSDEGELTCGSAILRVVAGTIGARFGTLVTSVGSGALVVASEPAAGEVTIANDASSSGSILVAGLPVQPGEDVSGLLDTDGDGLTDIVETNTGTFVGPGDTGTSPTEPDSDGDGAVDGIEVIVYATSPFLIDTDLDGCADSEEVGSAATLGGRRDPLDRWDFYDVNSSRNITIADIAIVKSKAGTTTGHPNYDPLVDRSAGLESWAPAGPNGLISIADVALVKASAGHTCVANP